MRRKKIDLKKVLESLITVCPSCGVSISPAEVMRVDKAGLKCAVFEVRKLSLEAKKPVNSKVYL